MNRRSVHVDIRIRSEASAYTIIKTGVCMTYSLNDLYQTIQRISIGKYVTNGLKQGRLDKYSKQQFSSRKDDICSKNDVPGSRHHCKE